VEQTRGYQRQVGDMGLFLGGGMATLAAYMDLEIPLIVTSCFLIEGVWCLLTSRRCLSRQGAKGFVEKGLAILYKRL
jgi:UDP-N-acetylmuramyl pentapeptide phosphotransferase/UDP-N-acetylglucosamine-1-phosphate transferase